VWLDVCDEWIHTLISMLQLFPVWVVCLLLFIYFNYLYWNRNGRENNTICYCSKCCQYGFVFCCVVHCFWLFVRGIAWMWYLSEIDVRVCIWWKMNCNWMTLLTSDIYCQYPTLLIKKKTRGNIIGRIKLPQ
jgi:hypothetical protein